MKHIIIIVLILSTLKVQGQQKIPTIDPSKSLGTTHSSSNNKAHFWGFVNPPSTDLKWKPTLSNITHSIEHEAPNQEYLDSLNKVNFRFKNEYRNTHKTDNAERTTVITPVVQTNFAGNTNDGWTPLDNSLAISNGGYIVSVTNDQIYYYDTTGSNLYISSLVSLLASASITVGSVCDPVVLYDYCADKFR